MLRIEWGLAFFAIIVAAIYPSFCANWLGRAEGAFGRLSQRRGLSVLVVALAALGLRLALLPIFPIPEPIVHDEFGYLLAADTFAHGRLTNPTHPMWEHFETFSVIQKPTYQCFAQPAQGMLLAFGKLVLGHPFWAVLLSVGLMCGAITWMLQGWLSPGWALLGGALAILRYGTLSYWANSYWGGAVAAIGGALVIGALPRIKSFHRSRYAWLMGIGLALLVNSRPYEGFVLSIPVAGALFVWMLGKNRPEINISLRRVVLPLTMVLSLTACGLCYYLWRVTGSPFRMPYQIERETYAVAPYLIWQHTRPEPVYHHAAMEKMYVQEELVGYNFFRSPAGFIGKLYLGWRFYLGPALALPFLMLPLALPRDFSLRKIERSTAFVVITLAIFAAGSALEGSYHAHYSAPVTGLILAAVLLAMRQLRAWSPAGAFTTRAILIICVLTFGLRLAAAPLRIPLSEFYGFAWHQKGPENFPRAAIQKQLEQIPGKQLVIVRYQADHEPFAEWVYNDADIDASKVAWAREMDSKEDQELLRYFRDRQVWLLEPDQVPPKLSAYKAPGA